MGYSGMGMGHEQAHGQTKGAKRITSLGLALKTSPSPKLAWAGPETHLPHQLASPGCNSPHSLSRRRRRLTPSRRDKASNRCAPLSRHVHVLHRLKIEFPFFTVAMSMSSTQANDSWVNSLWIAPPPAATPPGSGTTQARSKVRLARVLHAFRCPHQTPSGSLPLRQRRRPGRVRRRRDRRCVLRACCMPSGAHIKRLSMLPQLDSGCLDRHEGNGCGDGA
uniref:Uncharacterized protein n=1 Tax=Vitis vinifera TaxID=29760 RepID=A5B130_VITVI|nr:hypothetical protein VITISV_027434 [Vitis vinifera]